MLEKVSSSIWDVQLVVNQTLVISDEEHFLKVVQDRISDRDFKGYIDFHAIIEAKQE